jgi:hypothetical protein
MRHEYCQRIVCLVCLWACLSMFYQGRAMAGELHSITGVVQNQDLRRVGQAVVEVKNQEGTLVTTGVSNDAGE